MAICTHNWHIFKDPELVKTGYLSFFCTKCLALKKVQKDYAEKSQNGN